LDWIRELVACGHALEVLGGSDYPERFTARTEYLLPRILFGPPVVSDRWPPAGHTVPPEKPEGGTFVDRHTALQCATDEWLLVEALDLS